MGTHPESYTLFFPDRHGRLGRRWTFPRTRHVPPGRGVSKPLAPRDGPHESLGGSHHELWELG